MRRYRVIVTEPIHPDGIDLLRRECEVVELPPGADEGDLLSQGLEADALITRGWIRVTREFLEAAHRLKVVAVHGVGTDHVDLEAAAEHGVLVFNTPTALTESVAEMTVALILSLLRRVVAADGAVRRGEWERKYSDLVGIELMGKTVGILGLGRIGSAVARRLKGFDVNLLYYDKVERREVEEELGIRRMGLEELLSTSDIITIHVPLTPETHHMISSREFDLMKEGAYLVNLARGRVIDEEALIEPLRSGKLAGAALDVYEEEPPRRDNPLLSLENVILTPHIGASTREAMRRMALQSAEGVLTALRGGIPPNVVKP
ncbi:hydroxyacid dehydrogenase [Candidatus Bathyarchaeota archaeon]|nr:hydroxyacid dehydrogenase [Candidatus Bathyarchaeota archaeon]